jgi:cell division protein FtsI (penicillin-binding protein 3)
MSIKKDIKWRVHLCFLAICLLAVSIIWRVAALQIVSGKELKAKGQTMALNKRVLEAERGNIYSADGSLLSVSMPVFDIYFDTRAPRKDTFDKYITPLSIGIAKLLPAKSATQWHREFVKAYKDSNLCFEIGMRLDYDVYMKMRELPIFKLGKNKGGFIAKRNVKRINPFGLLGNRTIGLYRQNSANVGLEAKYNATLQGKNGFRNEQQIPGKAWMPVGDETEPQHGKDIITTIDVNVQGYAEQALYDVLKKENAAFGTCIVMETKTGAIKAMANLGRQENGDYWEDYNYALRPIEPGSTFKINTLLSAIDDGYVTLDSRISANGGVQYFNGQKMSDSHLGLGNISVKDAFSHSSNVACAKLIYNNYLKNPKQYIDHLQKMHIMDPTGIDIGGEQKPRISNQTLSFRNSASLAWLAIGYEVMITPLRTCMVYNTIANDGVMMKPFVVKEVREYGTLVQQNSPTVVDKNVCKPATITALKEAAFEVVEGGTGKALKNEHFTICGKTGTAQVADKGITYKDKVYHGSFVGFFPKEKPLYTICVVIRTRKGANNYYGGQIALPVFKEVANRLYAASVKDQVPFTAKDTSAIKVNKLLSGDAAKLRSLQSVFKFLAPIPNQPWLTTSLDSMGNSSIVAKAMTQNIVPSVLHMGLRDATKLLEGMGLKVIAKGHGKVISQSVNEGSSFSKGSVIKLELE